MDTTSLDAGALYALPSWHTSPILWALCDVGTELTLLAADTLEGRECAPDVLVRTRPEHSEQSEVLTLRVGIRIRLPRAALEDRAPVGQLDRVTPEQLAELATLEPDAELSDPELSLEMADWAAMLPRLARWTESLWARGRLELAAEDFVPLPGVNAELPAELPLAAKDQPTPPQAALLHFQRQPGPVQAELELPLLFDGSFKLLRQDEGDRRELHAFAEEVENPGELPMLAGVEAADATEWKSIGEGRTWVWSRGLSLPPRGQAFDFDLRLPDREQPLQIRLLG